MSLDTAPAYAEIVRKDLPCGSRFTAVFADPEHRKHLFTEYRELAEGEVLDGVRVTFEPSFGAQAQGVAA